MTAQKNPLKRGPDMKTNDNITRSVNIAFYEKMLEKVAEAQEEALRCARRMGLPESMANVLVNTVTQNAKTQLKKNTIKAG